MANVTLNLPDDLLRQARHLAVDEGLSLSRFVARALEQRVLAVRAYRTARERQLQLMDTGLSLGTATWTPPGRDALHER